MNNSEFNELRELSWRRALTPAEEARLQAYLVSHPEVQSVWEQEAALSELLTELPKAAVPSNFTARVLEAAERDQAAGRGTARIGLGGWFDSVRRLMPRLGWAIGAVLVVIVGFRQFESHRQAELDAGMVLLVKAVQASPVSDPAVFKDYEAINTMPPVAMDEDLWAALHP